MFMTGTCPNCLDVFMTGETQISKRQIQKEKKKKIIIKYHTQYYVGYHTFTLIPTYFDHISINFGSILT